VRYQRGGQDVETQNRLHPAWEGYRGSGACSYMVGMVETCRPGSSHGNQMAVRSAVGKTGEPPLCIYRGDDRL
jgi:hypothetical protein